MPQAMHYLQEELDISGTPIICYNGALVVHQEDIIYNESIPFEITRKVAQIGTVHNLHVSLYRNQEWFVPQMDQWAAREVHNTRTEPTVQDLAETLNYFEKTQNKGGAHKIMFMGDADKMELAFAKAEKLFSSQLHLYRSKDTYTEISPKGISKKTALELLLKARFPEVKMSQVVAFGDNYNDIELLAGVGYGVAVENARTEALSAAKYSTLHHKEDGVADWLEKNLLNKKTTP